MRACFRTVVVLLTSLLSMSGLAEAACAPMTAFIDKLKAGESAPDFPDITSCSTDFGPDLARALAAYVQTRPRTDVEPLVAMIKAAYHKAKRKTAFGDLAAAVQQDLATTGFKLPQTEDKYSLLDGLPQYAKAPLPPAPKPVPSAIPSAPPAASKSTPDAHRQPPAVSRITPSAVGTALAVVCGVAGLMLLVYVLIGRVRSFTRQIDIRLQALASASADLKTVLTASEIKLDRVETAQREMAGQLQSWGERFPPSAKILSPVDLDGVSEEIRELRNQVGRLENGHDPAVPPVMAGNVALEREALGESWKKFRQNEQLCAYVDNAAKDECWKQIGDPLLMHLPKLVPDDLKPTFEAVLAPAREYNNLLVKISLIPKIVNGELPRLGNDAQELARTRDFAQLLAMSYHSSIIGDRLSFRLKNWVVDSFLVFADLYLQRYQQLQTENRQEALEEGVSIIRRVLRVAAVEPIDVKLGETPFDSTRHIGRSTTNDARFSDGVIVGIVRNGFMESGNQIIRQPEVVVNRTR
ncbi:MAG TPA: hypothetical protein VF713_17745 [Thermoanaerobaculia bacterium]